VFDCECGIVFYVCLCMSVCVSVRVVLCLCLFQCLSLYVGVYVCVAIFFSTPILPFLRTHPQKRCGRSICGTITHSHTLTHTHTNTHSLSYPALLLSLNHPPSLYRMHPRRPWGRSMCGTTLHPTTSHGPRHPRALWTIRMIQRMEPSRMSSWITNSRITRSLSWVSFHVC